MLDFILNLPALVGCLIVMATTVVLGLSVYAASQRILFKDKQGELGDATRTIFLAVNLLVGLFLSLTLNDVLDELNAIEDAVEREAVVISDIFNGLNHFDTAAARDIQSILIDYTKAVLEDDWPSLAEDKLGTSAGASLRQLGSALLALEVGDRMEIASLDRIAADIDSMSDYRLARLHHALVPPPFFLLVVIFGFFVVMVCLGLYKPTRSLVVLVSFYMAFIGLVVYLILALSDPFQGIPGVGTAPLEYVLQEMRAARP